MNHRDRFFSTIHYQPVDRPASWLGLPVPSAKPALMKYFRLNSIDQIRAAVDDDIYPIKN
jgi:uroporphyrinogen decarboxylase